MKAGRTPTLQEHAAENLQFIRDTLAQAAPFTSLPGWGGVTIGLTAVVAAMVIGPPGDDVSWLASWLIEAAIAVTIGAVTMGWKAKRREARFGDAAMRRFALAFLPSIAAGAVLTFVLAGHGFGTRLPGCWLLLYGSGITSGGALSVRVVPLMGSCFMALAAVAFVAPVEWGNIFMALGFGGIQMVFSFVIARNYGG